MRERRPERSQQTALRALDDEQTTELVRAYVDAWERSDTAAIIHLLTEDATFSMPPLAIWYQGHDAIATFLDATPLQASWRLIPTEANNQLAFACYMLERTAWTAHSIDVIALRGDRIEHVTAFLQPELLGRFGFPSTLPGRSRPGGAA